MTMRNVGMALVLAVAAAGPARAQMANEEWPPVRVMAGLQLVGAVSTGEFADYVEGGFGVGANIVWPVQAEHWFALRGDLGWVVYGSETRDICLGGTGCLISLDLNTTNSILYVNAGPQLMAPRGPVRPYVNANAGFAYFSTTSSVKGDDSSDTFASDTNFDDFTFAWGAGAGFLVPLSSGKTPVLLDLGATYHGNGSVEYVTEDGITYDPELDEAFITPTRSEANFVSIRLGVTIGFRPGAN